jgi:hypothetical protein
MANKDKIDEAGAPAGVQSVTTETPAKADETSNAGANDAKANQPPVRTSRPDVPIAQSLAAGAGAHEARELDEDGLDADGIDADGRFVGK